MQTRLYRLELRAAGFPSGEPRLDRYLWARSKARAIEVVEAWEGFIDGESVEARAKVATATELAQWGDRAWCAWWALPEWECTPGRGAMAAIARQAMVHRATVGRVYQGSAGWPAYLEVVAVVIAVPEEAWPLPPVPLSPVPIERRWQVDATSMRRWGYK